MKYTLLLSLFFLFAPLFVSAESVSFDFKTKDGYVLADVFLESETSVNAIEGTIIFSGPIILEKIIDGKSIVALWVKTPVAQNNTVSFSGIIPGGLKGKEKVLSLSFKMEQDGIMTLGGLARGFQNDGEGTVLDLLLASQTHPFSLPEGGVRAKENPFLADATPPVITQEALTRNEAMFNGEPFLILRAEDAETGVADIGILVSDRKEDVLKLQNDERFATVDFPHPIPEKDLEKYVYVRVRDNAGNAFVKELFVAQVLSPAFAESWFKKWLGLGILILLILAGGFLVWRIVRRNETNF